jgi:glycosyltransferase involved in cell wall biosynthesis
MHKNNKKPLRIWILQDGEQLPLIEGSKPMRSWRLGEELAQRGHQVIWWSSNFNHMSKEKVCEGDHIFKIEDNFILKLLEAGTYKKNLSLARVRHHNILGRRFKSEAIKEKKPDIIVACHPIVEFSYEAVQYGKTFNVPVIVDVRDMWPDTFADYFPKVFAPFIKLSTYFMRKKTQMALEGASEIVAASQSMLKWALKFRKGGKGKIFHHSTDPLMKEVSSSRKLDFIRSKKDSSVIISFIGTFGQTYDLDTICKAAKKIKYTHPNVLFVLAGDGEKFSSISAMTKDYTNIHLLGWLNKEECRELMFLTDIGLVPIKNDTIPNKFGEYLSAGKPVISSGTGEELINLIDSYNIGFSYKPQDTNSLLVALNQVLTHNFYKSLSPHATHLFNLKFNAQNIYSSFAELVEEIGTC